MKKAILPLLLLFIPLMPIKASSQQINNFGVCTQYREIYVPGGYDDYGNYYSGEVRVESFNVPCNNLQFNTVPYRPYYGYRYYGYYCNPTRTFFGATLGGSIGRALTSTRNNRRNRGWATALGASIGGLAFTC